jgi:uncharacterized protein (TIRG00374 family)
MTTFSLPSTARRLVSVLVTVGCLVLLARIVDPGELGAALASASVPLLIAAVLVRAFDRLVMIWKWFPFLRIQLPDVSFLHAARAYLVSGLAIYMIPISVGADVVRAGVLGRDEKAVPEVGASIIAERLIGIAATGMLSLIALFVAYTQSIELTFVLPWALAAVVLGLLALVAPLSERVASWGLRSIATARRIPGRTFLSKVATAYQVYGSHPGLLLAVGVASVFEQFLSVVVAWIIVKALGLSISFLMLMVAIPLAIFAGRIPVSLGGIGITEGAIVYLLGLFGVSTADALALSLVARAIDIFVVSVPGAFLWRDMVTSHQGSGKNDDSNPGLVRQLP